MAQVSPPSPARSPGALAALLALSGASALICEIVWMRRLALAIGSTGLALTLTLSLYMVGLGVGGWIAGKIRWTGAPRGYGALELGAAGWVLGVPVVIAALGDLPGRGPGGAAVLAAALLLPPALLHGATLPAAAAAVSDGRGAGTLYASNTAGAVLGALLGSFLLLPALGVRGAELAAAGLSALAGVLAWRMGARGFDAAQVLEPEAPGAGPTWAPLLAAFAAGAAALSLEVAWSRLGSLLLGGSVYAMAVVLAVFLAGVALGAAFGRRLGLGPALALLGLGAVAGSVLWRWLPHGLGLAFAAGGEDAVLPAGALLMALAMGFSPVASGAVFTAALAEESASPARAAGRVLAANTAGSALGAAAAGLLALPALGISGLVIAVGVGCVGLAVLLPGGRAGGKVASVAGLAALLTVAPPWDAPLYAVGLYHRLDQFADLSPRAVERFAHDGWRLLLSRDGVTATVAVGESATSGVRWLSVNGKVDASSGEDMPTQVLSGQLPVLIAAGLAPDQPLDAVVVGLASGVTAGEALAAGARSVVAIEIEPAVVEAAALFAHVNHDVLEDPRATVVIDDARAWLSRPGPRHAVLISEPSNPWLTGVSNLFTLEYWTLARARLRDDGVFCQWVQLYALPPTALRSIVRTFLEVFPNTWLFETIPGADALLIAAPALPEGLPIQPLLGPAELRALAGVAPLNTDDRPWVEFEAPWWLYRSTGAANREMLQSAQAGAPP